MNYRIFLFFLVMLWLSCKKPVGEPVKNIPPDTHIFVEGEVDTVPAYQIIHWYGNDPDGYVVGYYYHWDNDTPVFTVKNVDTFTLSVPENDSIGEHILYVSSVDNEGALDPTPATLTIPARNSPPTISFVHNSLPPDTTFPHITFYIETHDIDGDESVIGFYFRTDYDTTWIFQSIDTNYVTFKNVPEGTRIFYFRAVDKSQAVSSIIADTIYVLPVTGNILVIDDSQDASADNTFRQFFEDNYTGNFSLWDVGKFLPYSFYDIDGIINDLGFTLIFWYTDVDKNSITPLRKSIQTFIKSGKSLFFVSPSVLDSVNDPNDTLSSKDFMNNYLGVKNVIVWNTMMLNGGVVNLESGDTLSLSQPIFKLEIIEPNDSIEAECIFKAFANNIVDSISCVGVRFPASQPRVYFFSAELNKFSGNSNLFAVLKEILDSMMKRR